MGTTWRRGRVVIVLLLLLCCWSGLNRPVRAGSHALATTCPIFPRDNIWNTAIDHLPVAQQSAAYVATIGTTLPLKADWGSGTWNGGPIGIPLTTIPAGQPRVPMSFGYANESDAGPYPFPRDALIEGGPASHGDRHVLVVEPGTCKLYETWSSYPQPDGSWQAGSGAIWDLNSNALRPAGWTSADAAGLPILAGLVRYDEVAAGTIAHAIRFTVPQTQSTYVWPARHQASADSSPTLPPMGQRFRLRADFDTASFSPMNRVVLQALKTYGMLVADNGSSWYMSGVPDERWNNADLHDLDRVHGSDFEAVDEQGLLVNPDSAQANTTLFHLSPRTWLPVMR